MKKASIGFFMMVFLCVLTLYPLSKAEERQNPFVSGLEGYTLVSLPEINELEYVLNDKEGRLRMAYGIICEYFPFVYSGCARDDLSVFIPVDYMDAKMEMMDFYRGDCFCASFRHLYSYDVTFTVFISFSNQSALFSEFPDMNERIDCIRNATIDANTAVRIAREHAGITDAENDCITRASLVFTEEKCLWHISLYQKTGPYSLDTSAEVNQFADYYIDVQNGEIFDYAILLPTVYDIFIEQCGLSQ